MKNKKSKLRKKFEILTYNVGFITKPLDKVLTSGIEENDIHWMKHDYKDRFFADPFLIKEDEEYYYVLCEEYIFWEEKGKISLLIIKKSNFELETKKIVIEENYHLSFPACFYGENVVKPEACKSNKYYEYRLDLEKFVVLEKKEILNEGTIDAIEFKNNYETFLLSGKVCNPSGELYIYKMNNGTYNKNNNKPVLINKSCSRNAGNIFKWNENLYRPVQDCSKRYGQQIKIMKINKLNEFIYDAESIITLNSFKNKPFNETMHTFNVYNDFVLVDGSKDILRFPMKIFYKKFRFLFKNK